MKKIRIKQIGSILLGAVLLSNVLFAAQPVQASDTVEQVTHIDFDDATSVSDVLSIQPNLSTKDWGKYISIAISEDGNHALQLESASDNNYYLYLANGWNEKSRPTEIQYRFKLVNTGTNDASGIKASMFCPIYHGEPISNNYCRGPILYHKVIQQTGGGLEFSTASNSYCKKVATTTTTSENFSVKTTEAEAQWYQLKCSYDWSEYNPDNNSYKVTLSVMITDTSTGKVYLDATQVYSKGENTYMQEIATKTLSFGFATVKNSGIKTWIDDIYVWSENFSTGATYGPTSQPEVLGATPATAETNDSVKVKMGFDYSDVTSVAEANEETPIQYGAVLVAGSPSYSAMTSSAAVLLDADETNDSTVTDIGYKCTKKTLGDGETLPDEYYITITNSSENIGKRASAIGYVITEAKDGTQNIYYTSKQINHSVMSLLKAAFNVTYLTDENNVSSDGALVSDSPLAKALNEYNTNNVTEESLNTIKAATAGGATTTEQRSLLMQLHFALHSMYVQ